VFLFYGEELLAPRPTPKLEGHPLSAVRDCLFNIFAATLYSSPSIIRVIKARRMRWAGHVARMKEVRGAYNIFVGRPGGRRPLGRPRRRWEDNIKMDLREIGFGDMDWIHLFQDRGRWRAVVNTVMNLRVP
jgi:hypothetical protein